MHPKTTIIITLGAGIMVLALIVALTLTQAPPRLVRVAPAGAKGLGLDGSNGVASLETAGTFCQTGEVVPKGVTAVRVGVWGYYGAPVRVLAYQGSRLVTEGQRVADWTGASVTVPVRTVKRTVAGVKLCVVITQNDQPLSLLGKKTSPEQAAVATATDSIPAKDLSIRNGQPLEGRVVVEYLAPGRGSWWSRIVSVARRMGLGRSFTGTWIALLAAALMAAAGILALRLTVEEWR